MQSSTNIFEKSNQYKNCTNSCLEPSSIPLITAISSARYRTLLLANLKSFSLFYSTRHKCSTTILKLPKTIKKQEESGGFCEVWYMFSFVERLFAFTFKEQEKALEGSQLFRFSIFWGTYTLKASIMKYKVIL